MIKKSSKRVSKIKREIILVSIVATVLAVAGILTFAYILPAANNNIRKERIVAIYDSLKLDKTYLPTYESVFGEKRVYSYDAGRSYSSSKLYVRGANVDTTVAELKTAVTAAGFSYVGEPYPGSTAVQLHYKSAKNEYIRFTVDSKPRMDAFFNESHMGIKWTAADFALDPNAGPSNVTIKVNLDDNNE